MRSQTLCVSNKRSCLCYFSLLCQKSWLSRESQQPEECSIALRGWTCLYVHDVNQASSLHLIVAAKNEIKLRKLVLEWTTMTSPTKLFSIIAVERIQFTVSEPIATQVSLLRIIYENRKKCCHYFTCTISGTGIYFTTNCSTDFYGNYIGITKHNSMTVAQWQLKKHSWHAPRLLYTSKGLRVDPIGNFCWKVNLTTKISQYEVLKVVKTIYYLVNV